MNQTRKWSLVAALTVVAVLAAGWFLLVAPKRGDAADLRTQDGAAQAENLALQAKLDQLKALAPQLPKKQAEFAAIRKQIPDNPALPDLVRQLTVATKKSGVDLTSISPATPVVLVAAAPVAPVASADATTTADGGAVTAAPAAAATDQLLQVPLSLLVSGNYTELSDFIDRLEGLRRVMLVTGFTLTKDTATTASAGALSLSSTGRVFMVHSAPAVVTPVAPAAAAGSTAGASTTGTATTETPATAGGTQN